MEKEKNKDLDDCTYTLSDLEKNKCKNCEEREAEVGGYCRPCYEEGMDCVRMAEYEEFEREKNY